jgi:hypothetical protein
VTPLSMEDQLSQALSRIYELEGKRSTTLSGVQFLVLCTFVPMVFAFLFLAGRMIWSATGNPEILRDIEGLLAALAILSNPVSMGMGVIMGALSDEIKTMVKGAGVKSNGV